MLLALLSIMDVIGGGGAAGGAGSASGRSSPTVNGVTADSPKIIPELKKLLKSDKKQKIIKVGPGTPVYRVEFAEYPKFEAKMHEFQANNDWAVVEVMRTMLKRQREQDDEEALIALMS